MSNPLGLGAEVGRPRYSVVTAAYNVASFLPDFIASVDGLKAVEGGVEIIVVDDGSTDETLALLRRWEQGSQGAVRVLSQPNAGQGAARNRGLEDARGEWVTFPDPDDILKRDYLSRVDRFLRRNPHVDMVATNRLLLNDETGEVTATHPLRAHFRGGDVARDLTRQPQFFQGSAPAAFFRTEVLRGTGLRFDPRIRPNFEDGHFCSRYLLGFDRPVVGFVASAHYHYRKRQDQSSTLQTSRSHPGRYTDVLRHGYLDVLRRGDEFHGGVPAWLQYFIIYELSYYFRAEDSLAPAGAPATVRDEFHALAAEILELLDPDIVRDYRVSPLTQATRDLLVHAYRAEPWRGAYGIVQRQDRQQRLVELHLPVHRNGPGGGDPRRRKSGHGRVGEDPRASLPRSPVDVRTRPVDQGAPHAGVPGWSPAGDPGRRAAGPEPAVRIRPH